METLSIGIIGAGAWGTALGTALASGGHRVQLWAMEEDVVESINKEHENKRYLSGYRLNDSVTCCQDIKKVAEDKDVLILATPSLYLASTISRFTDVKNIQDGSTIVASITKGFVPSDDIPHFVLETMENALPECYKGCTVYIAGPSHAEEVALGKITGLIAASNHHRNAIKVRDMLRAVKGIMAYASFDTIGVQVCAAVKNVIAVVYGSMDALAETSDIFGDNTESLLMAAGLNEIQQIGFAMGATHAATFTSISGVGDLDVTCKSKFGRNRKFGQDLIKTDMLNRFSNLDDLIANIKKVGYLPEGAIACKYVHQIAEKKNLKLPICNALYEVLNKEKTPEQCLKDLVNGKNY